MNGYYGGHWNHYVNSILKIYYFMKLDIILIGIIDIGVKQTIKRLKNLQTSMPFFGHRTQNMNLRKTNFTSAPNISLQPSLKSGFDQSRLHTLRMLDVSRFSSRLNSVVRRCG